MLVAADLRCHTRPDGASLRCGCAAPKETEACALRLCRGAELWYVDSAMHVTGMSCCLTFMRLHVCQTLALVTFILHLVCLSCLLELLLGFLQDGLQFAKVDAAMASLKFVNCCRKGSAGSDSCLFVTDDNILLALQQHIAHT